jgi:hypothetical protein
MTVRAVTVPETSVNLYETTRCNISGERRFSLGIIVAFCLQYKCLVFSVSSKGLNCLLAYFVKGPGIFPSCLLRDVNLVILVVKGQI